MAENRLMFEVGVQEANGQLTKLEERFETLVKNYGSLKVKVEVENLKDFVNALKTIGDGKVLKPLLDRIESLQTSLTKLNGAMGNVDMSSLKNQLNAIKETEERIRKLENDLKAKGATGLHIGNATATDRMIRDNQIRTLERNFGMTVEAAKHYIKTAETAGDSSSKLNSKIEQLSQSITALSGKTFSVNIGNEFKTWAEQVQALVAQVKELVVQMEKLHSSQGAGSQKAQGGIFDPQRFSTLQDAIDKVISEVNRLKEAFSSIGSISGIDSLKTTINGLQVEVNNLVSAMMKITGAIHIDKSAEEIAAFERKIAELKTQYEQLQSQVQQTTTSIQQQANAANNAGTATQNAANEDEKATQKANIEKQRQIKLLSEVQAMYEKIANLFASGTGLNGQSLKSLGDSFQKLIKDLGTIPPNRSLAELSAEFATLKLQAKGFFSEISKEAKATEMLRDVRLALRLVNNELNKVGGNSKLEGLRDQLQSINKLMSNLKKAGNFDEVFKVFSGHKGMSDGALNIIRQAVNEMKKLGISTQETAGITSHLTAEEYKLAQSLNRVSQEARGQSQVMSDLKMLATQYLGVWGAQGFLKNIIEIGGQLEMQRLSIGAILGDMAKASELFDRIKNLAIKSPFGVVELDQMTKQLSAYGFEYSELFDMTKRLADISAATGTSVDRLALALGHVRSEAALSGYTLRQFSMANIPLAKKLSEELSKVEGKLVSVADVRKRVKKKEISYEDVLKVLKDLTDEGGMFYNAQEIMAESVKAKYKNLKDSMDIMYNEIAESKVGASLKNVATLLTTLTRHWQELGAVIVAGASYWAINRVAMMASNKIMVQANLTMGRFSAAQLEMQATTGNLTRAQLLQAVATKKLAVADAEAAGAVLGLSRAQLQHVANTGKASAALNMATLATSKYTISQLRLLATMRSMKLGWIANGWLLLTNGIKAAGVAALGFMKAMWPMLAISGIVEVFMSMKREAEQFADAANYVGQSARNMMKDIDETMRTINKDGKPLDEEGLRNAVNSMKEILEQSEFYTEEQQKQVDKATTLSAKYDILLKQLKEMREEAEWQTNNESLVETILKNTGKNVNVNTARNYNSQTGEYEYVTSQTFGSSFFNNSLQENIEQVNKSNSKLQSAIQLLSEYQGVMDEAIKKNNSFGLSLEGKSWQEQIKMIAQSGHWDEFVASVENAGSRFEGTAANVKKASDKVVEDWKSIVGDDVKAIRLTLMQEWGMTENELNQFAKNNEKTMRWLVDSIAKSLSKLGVAEVIIDDFKQKLLELFGVAASGKSTKREPTEYEKQTDLGKRLMRNVLNYNKNNGQGGNGVTTVKEINEITGTGENQKSVSEVTKTLKERAQKSLENMNETKRLYGESSKVYKEAKKKWEHDLNLAQSNGISESEIRTGKYKTKVDKTDENAKAVREEMRILKEAADAFQYWRDKVGDDSAWSYVEEEFGDVLSRIGVTAKNVNDLRGNIERLTPKIQKIKDKKVRNETFKEQAKELAQLNRKDFEKTTEEFASKVQIELDTLTRAWDLFNDVREKTGDIDLAVRISGAEYGEGKNRNLADALKEKIKKDLSGIKESLTVDFDVNLSDEAIQRMVENAFETMKPVRGEKESKEDYTKRLSEYQTRIKGVVEEYKKWRDLQRDVAKGDISVFSQLLSSAQDYETQIRKINSNLEKQEESIDKMARPDGYTDEEWDALKKRAKAIANANAEFERMKKSSQYINLMNRSIAMTQTEVNNAADAVRDGLNKSLEAGAISAQEYADEMAKLDKITSEWKKDSVGGVTGPAISYVTGGIDKLLKHYDDRINKRRTDLANNGATEEEINNDEEIKRLEDARKATEDFANTLNSAAKVIDFVTNILNGLGEAAQGLSEMFDALGKEGAANTWSDIADAISAASSSLTSLSNGMKAGAQGDIGGVISGVVGTVTKPTTGIAKLHDKKLDRRLENMNFELKKMDNTLNLIKKLRERELGYDSGNLRRQIAAMYVGNNSAAGKAMGDYYNRTSSGNGYSQELTVLMEQRKTYMDMYNTENKKKKKSKESLEEYKTKIAELDEQIIYFTQDLAKELWGIDIKGWASQISDALWNAFENGEDAVKAFGDTAKSIVSDVAKRMMNLHFIEPLFSELEDELFGTIDSNGNRVKGKAYTNGNWNEEETLKVLGEFFGENGKLAKNIADAENFYKLVEKVTGMDFSSKSSTSSKVIQGGFTENETGLMLSYINAMRGDLSVNRTMIAEYFPMYYAAMTNGNASLRNIENHTAAIMRSNDAIKEDVTEIYGLFKGLRLNSWRIPMA